MTPLDPVKEQTKYKLVKIDWVDITEHGEIWVKDGDWPSLSHFSTTGWLVNETLETVTIASTIELSDDHQSFANVITFPRVVIEDMEFLS